MSIREARKRLGKRQSGVFDVEVPSGSSRLTATDSDRYLEEGRQAYYRQQQQYQQLAQQARPGIMTTSSFVSPIDYGAFQIISQQMAAAGAAQVDRLLADGIPDEED